MLEHYECDGQLSLFDFIKDDTDTKFNPLEALALHGTGFVNGMDRVYKFFTQDKHTIHEKSQFLKKRIWNGWIWQSY